MFVEKEFALYDINDVLNLEKIVKSNIDKALDTGNKELFEEMSRDLRSIYYYKSEYNVDNKTPLSKYEKEVIIKNSIQEVLNLMVELTAHKVTVNQANEGVQNITKRLISQVL